MRPAHTRGTVSEPGLNGESRGVLMMISLSTSDWLDKFIKRRWASGCFLGGLRRSADPVAHDESMKRLHETTP